METGGEPYLRSLEPDLSIFVRHSLDVYGLGLLAAGVAVFITCKIVLCGVSCVARAHVSPQGEHIGAGDAIEGVLSSLRTTKTKAL